MDVKIAICQRPAVLLDRAASLAVALEAMDEAAAAGARLITFPEAFLPGYPSWIWRLKPGADMGLGNEIHARLRRNAVDIPAGHLDPIRAAAARLKLVTVIGMHELDSGHSGSTLFNTVVIIGSDGAILNRHRKLMPTNPERMVWGMGDAAGLRVVETGFGRLGVLLCWENYMPLARYGLYAQGIDILAAPTWDTGDIWTATMRHIAREGGCFVLSSAMALSGADVPKDFPGREQLFDDSEWINPGDALVVQPGGAILAGPQSRDKSLLYAMIDVAAAARARKSLDVAGHYSRPDLFHLTIDRQPHPPVRFED